MGAALSSNWIGVTGSLMTMPKITSAKQVGFERPAWELCYRYIGGILGPGLPDAEPIKAMQLVSNQVVIC